MKWLRVGEKVWRDFWALLQVIHCFRYVFFFEGGWLLACMGWIWWSGTYVYVFRLEAKCSALSYKTPLGTGRNGSKRRLACDEETQRTILVFLLLTHRLHDVGEGGGERGGTGFFFSCPNCTWSMRWSVMVWDVIFIGQSPNPFFFFPFLPYSFSLRCSLYSAPAKFQFLIGYTAPCTVILLIFIVLPARRVPGLRQSNLISNHYLEVGNQA